ncbi:helix-turn-helix transcriptional regulator [Sphingobacterium spiritivorum]|uniref:helix-turn-helix transcriptional regulator n=1 Tax=Sphingobacterium spiritivorum TaxID=258 RepID=UPI003DA27C52
MITLTLQDVYGIEIISERFYTDNYKINRHLKQFDIHHPVIQGFDRFIVLEEIIISHKKWEIVQPFRMYTKHEKEFLKCQFEIDGHSIYNSKERTESISINGGHCHFFYLPSVDGDLLYPRSREVLDIMIDSKYLLQLMEEENLTSDSLAKAITQKKLFKFFNQEKVISPKYKALIQDIIRQPYNGSFVLSYLKCKAIELIITLLKDADQLMQDPHHLLSESDIQILSSIKESIESEPWADYSLMGLARQFGINDFKLKRGFKILFQKTVFAFILEQRMVLSLDLIKNTSLGLKEISLKAGFKHQHHFSQRFKSYFGFLPREYRKGINS